jgi:glycerophosphoryl diester phosphodiesterase
VTIAIAHRGHPLVERENTLASFAAAVLGGADMIELDLRCTGDGHIVVLHDATLTRLWGVDRSVVDLDLAEVQQIGGGGIPTLRQALGHVALPLMVDFTAADVVQGALEAVRDADAMARCLFVTGNVDALRSLRAAAPDARIGLTWIEGQVPPTSLLHELEAEFWNPVHSLVTPEGVAAVHDLGLKVSTWTVDERPDMKRVSDAGVDAIVSNRIVDLRRHLSNPPA